jgi:hypothetical protein
MRKGTSATEEQRSRNRAAQQARFKPIWERIAARLIPAGDCLIWSGVRQRSGYGRVSFNGKAHLVHRLVWEGAYGPIPTGMDVLHRCDTPPCSRIDHLFLGDDKLNVDDRESKGRTARGDRHASRTKPETLARGDQNGARLHPERLARGEQHGVAKLTEMAVREIRHAVRNGASQRSLAKKYGVDKRSIGRIVRGVTWAHVDWQTAGLPAEPRQEALL